MKKQSGYSLVEFLIIVAIIGIMAAIAIPSMKRSQEASVKAYKHRMAQPTPYPTLSPEYFAEAARKAIARQESAKREEAERAQRAKQGVQYIYCPWRNDMMLESIALSASIERRGEPPTLFWTDQNGVAHSHSAISCHVSGGPLVLPNIVRPGKPPTETPAR